MAPLCHPSLLSYRRVFKTFNSNTGIASHEAHFDLDKKLLFRKYYGKKVRTLINDGNNPSSCLSNRYQALRSFKVYSSLPNRWPSRSIKDLSILCSGSSLKDDKAFQFIKKLRQYKHLISLQIKMDGSALSNLSFCRHIRALKPLQSLELGLTESQLIKNSKHILNMKFLKSISIHVSTASEKNDKLSIIEFYSKLVKLDHLEFLKLNLLSISYSSSLLNTLLQALSETQIPSFHISIKSVLSGPVNTDYLNVVLQQVGCFILSCNSNYSACFTSNMDKSDNRTNSKRKLELDLISRQALRQCPSAPEIHDNQLLENIKQYFVSILGISAHTVIEAISNKNLTGLSIDLKGLNARQLSFTIRHLADVLKHANTLEHLSLRNVTLNKKFKSDLELYELGFKEIHNLKNLRSLEIMDFIIAPDLMHILVSPLISLTNLQKFSLHFSSSDAMCDAREFSIKFPEDSMLELLDIQLSGELVLDKADMIKEIHKLRKLQRLRITGGGEHINKENWARV